MPSPRRLAGAAFLLAAYLPLHRLLDPGHTGLAGATTRRLAEDAWSLGVWGTVLVLGAAAALAVVVRHDPTRLVRPALDALSAVRPRTLAGGAAATAFLLSGTATWFLFGALPTSVDEMVQLLHARALLGGRVGMPLPGDPAAWLVQNSVMTPQGWASVYPPLHTGALALGMLFGVPWLVGPLATGAMVFFTARALPKLLPDDPGVTRVATVLMAASPFILLLGATHLSHTLAGALAAGTLWAALKARDGGARWSPLAGAMVGAFVCTRPWTGMVISTGILASIWLPALRSKGGAWAARSVGGLMAGGLPFAVLLGAWNRVLFGHPLRLGYTVAFGPSHGLGFHTDPWGNRYGALEALAYTGADLVQLGTALLDSPLPALTVVGLGLLLAPQRWRGAGPLFAWIAAGLVANAAYWHHGIHLGPRFLFETAPGWVGLWALGAAALTRGSGPKALRLRSWGGWVVLFALGGTLVGVPGRLASVGGGQAASVALPPPPSTPALVFAHGSWPSRVGARLVAAGMRRDSVETALRRNDICAVDRYARWRTDPGDAPPPGLELAPLPGRPAELTPVSLSEGHSVLVRPGVPPDLRCQGEARSDRFGTVELEPLAWMAPPLPGSEVALARDLGPARNEAVLRAFPERTAYLLVAGPDGSPPRFMGYEEGMALLWGVNPDGG